MLEVLQRPGEIVYVPPQWWHVVLNLDDTAAITHNYLSRNAFSPQKVWSELVIHQNTFAGRWFRQVSIYEKAIAKQIFDAHLKLRRMTPLDRKAKGITQDNWNQIEAQMPQSLPALSNSLPVHVGDSMPVTGAADMSLSDESDELL
mmetsp:Transcript_18219/g.29030  ORF Transcript_18219/g.29030 Transcript_18219/m.29030 type:complete len:146 (-) Transcript_18219:69-506(-)